MLGKVDGQGGKEHGGAGVIKQCKRGHDYEVGKFCRECKNLRDREFQRRNKKPKALLSEEEIEKRREYSRNRYAEKMKNPEWAKNRSKKTSARYSFRIKTCPEAKAKDRQRNVEQWAALKADPERYAKEREAGNKRSLAYYHRQFDRQSNAADTAKRLLEKAKRMAEQEKMGIVRVGA